MANFADIVEYKGNRVRLGWHNLATYAKLLSSNPYINFKTNQPLNTYVMNYVSLIGARVGNPNISMCSWTWYSYSYLIAHGMQSLAPGATPTNIYMSSDGSVCFSCLLNDWSASSVNNFLQLHLEYISANPTGTGYNLQITAQHAFATSGTYYA